MNRQTTVKYAFKASLPVMAGYLVLGAGFGILLQSKGYAWWWSPIMSISIYAGAMQYVAVDLLTSGATVITSALMTLMINFRHLFYGITMLEKYKDTGAKKPYLIFALTDETFSLVCSPELPEGVDEQSYYLFLSLFNHSYWIVGTTAGALLGTALSFNSTGMDFAMTALFIVTFVEQWEKNTDHLPALTGLVISLLCLVVLGPSNFLIPAMIGITAALFIEKNLFKEEESVA